MSTSTTVHVCTRILQKLNSTKRRRRRSVREMSSFVLR